MKAPGVNLTRSSTLLRPYDLIRSELTSVTDRGVSKSVRSRPKELSDGSLGKIESSSVTSDITKSSSSATSALLASAAKTGTVIVPIIMSDV